jgi:16S rRNA processing protein RimM
MLAGMRRVFIVSEGEYQEREVLTASVSGDMVLMSISGVESREDAIRMKGAVLYLKREDIPLKDGDMLIVDMIGLPVTDDRTGRVYGEIKDVFDAPRSRIYTIATDGKDVLLPDVPEFIKRIDAEEGLFITPIPGFFEEV